MGKHHYPMKRVVVVGADAQEAASICSIIEEGDYETAVCSRLEDLAATLADPCMAAILDVDTVPLDNRAIRTLTRSHPGTCFLCTSRERFHPDLEESFRHHLFACLHKPVDPDELHYFLKCIRDDATESRGPPREQA